MNQRRRTLTQVRLPFADNGSDVHEGDRCGPRVKQGKIMLCVVLKRVDAAERARSTES